MRFIKYLILFFLTSFIISCEEASKNFKDASLDSIKISNCSDVISRLETCLDIHEGSLDYVEQSCSKETISFVKENVDYCERLVEYFMGM